MLNRHHSMSSVHHYRQPMTPFKWRPFDMYNDVHVHDTHPSQQNVCERLTASNCVQSYQCEFNHLHTHLGLDQRHVIVCDNDVREQHHRQRGHRHRQSSRGSSSGGSSGSCASLSTVSRYFVNDIDNSESILDTAIVSCGSMDCFCCKLDSQRMSNNDKTMSKSAKHQQQQQCDRHTDCSPCYNVKCCTPNCRKISSKYTKIMNNNSNADKCSKTDSKSLVNRVVVLPFDGIDYTYKCEQSMIGTLNHCESPSMTTITTTPTTTKVSANSNGSNHNDCPSLDHCMKINHCCHAGYFDSNWMIGHKKQRPNADASSKYTHFHI